MMTALTYGLYAAGVSIAITLLEYFTGLDKTTSGQMLGYLSLPFLAWFIFMASKERKEDEFDGTMTYGQGVGTGAMIGLFSGAVMAVFMVIYIQFINSGFIDMIVQKQEEAFKASGKMTPSDIKNSLGYVRTWALPMTVIFSVIGNTFFATIFALITSIFVRTKEDDGVVKAG